MEIKTKQLHISFFFTEPVKDNKGGVKQDTNVGSDKKQTRLNMRKGIKALQRAPPCLCVAFDSLIPTFSSGTLTPDPVKRRLKESTGFVAKGQTQGLLRR